MKYDETSADEINILMDRAWVAFHAYRKLSLKCRADFMRAIAVEVEQCGDELIHTAMRETNLPEARLRGERARTIFQLNSYAAACEEGMWLDVRIDTAAQVIFHLPIQLLVAILPVHSPPDAPLSLKPIPPMQKLQKWWRGQL
jgi:acyl-CoA reductase-like NAD-dependent aldehyde dehydrogenase